MNRYALLAAAAGMIALSSAPGYAYEAGGAAKTKPGSFIGASAGVPPPGVYMFNQVFTYQSNLTGPGVNNILGGNTHVGVQAAVDVQGFLFVPGWTFLGATYDALVVQPFVMNSVGAATGTLGPLPASQAAGMFNTYIVPVELAWQNIADTGLAVKVGLAMYVPDGTVTGVLGTGNVGAPYWTFQPEVIVSYLKDGWNLSAAIYEEFNTRNTISNYRSGNILHADFTATKTIGKWTLGPVAYYYGQVSDDSCSSINCLAANPTGTLLNAQRTDVWAVGGLLGYNFGPAAVSVWATQEVSAKASNVNPAAAALAGGDPSLVTKGLTVFGTLSYRLWGPDEEAHPVQKLFHK
jgi:hypothetical protein